MNSLQTRTSDVCFHNPVEFAHTCKLLSVFLIFFFVQDDGEAEKLKAERVAAYNERKSKSRFSWCLRFTFVC